MGEILNTCVIGKPVSDEFDTLLPDKIEVVDCESYPDCSYIETVRFTFSVCNQKGATPGFHGPKQIVYLKIEAGYIPVERVKLSYDDCCPDLIFSGSKTDRSFCL